jgi:hypothetical protein
MSTSSLAEYCRCILLGGDRHLSGLHVNKRKMAFQKHLMPVPLSEALGINVLSYISNVPFGPVCKVTAF